MAATIELRSVEGDRFPAHAVRLLALGGFVYVGVFAAVDALLEAYVNTPEQMLARLLLITVALVGGLAAVLHILLRVQVAQQRTLEHALSAMSELTGAIGHSTHGGAMAISDQPLLRAHNVPLLTRREREVAMLIARGYSNREIAEVLVISTRTADTHAERILAKLGVHSRTAIASWVLSRASMPSQVEPI